MPSPMRWNKKLSRSIRRFFRLKLLDKHGVAMLASSKNGLLAVEPGDMAIGRRLLRDGSYDWDEICWLKAVVNEPKATLLNVGTHIGAILVPLSKHFDQAWAFEADPTNFELLQTNLRLNNCHNVHAHHNAIGDSAGSIFIERNLLNTGNSSVNRQARSGTEVSMIRLDQALPDHTFDLMIIDIEGFEPQAIAGLGEKLNRLRRIYIEFCPALRRAQGNEPERFFAELCAQFPFCYELGEHANEISAEQRPSWLREVLSRPKHLRNLLLCREPLNSKALEFKRGSS